MTYNDAMTEFQPSRQVDLAIIGGGAAGTLTAINALRQATDARRVVVFEPASALGQGIAYATPWPEHLLNVPAGRMSGFPEQPDDFLKYLQAQREDGATSSAELAGRYMPRLTFADYLLQRLGEAEGASPATLQVVDEAVLALQLRDGRYELQTTGGERWQATQVVLACGNSMRPLPLPAGDALPPGKVVDAWDYDGVRMLAGGDDLAIVGSGLSMADCVVSLVTAGHRGRIHVISRHGLLPLPHAHGGVADFDPQPLLLQPLRARMRTLRAHVRAAQAQGLPWQAVMERIRPLGQALWGSLEVSDQRRFLRHVVRYWDVHRHRIAESVHAQLAALERSGQLQRHRARLDAVLVQGSTLQVHTRAAHGGTQPLNVGAVINATGVETRALAMRNPLLQQLLADGHARPGPHGLGLDSDDTGRLYDAHGQLQPGLQVVGSLRIGTLWESLAIPELRGQAQQAAVGASGRDQRS
jgi:uncharacterized NAD(P)/FAD-binding protein YdhS